MLCKWVISSSAVNADSESGSMDGGCDKGVLWLLFMGWASDARLVENLVSSPAFLSLNADSSFTGDVLCLYDYREMELEIDFERYDKVYIFAWSFGVWAAEQSVASRDDLRRLVCGAVAVGGTPLGVHPQFGIPRRAFDVTLRGVEVAGLQKFRQRMCGELWEWYSAIYSKDVVVNSPSVDHRSQLLVERGVCDAVEELRVLGERFDRCSTPGLSADNDYLQCVVAWDYAVVGAEDLIFPPEAQVSFWRSVEVDCRVVSGMPHLFYGDVLAEFFVHFLKQSVTTNI